MTIILIVILSAAILLFAYFTYGKYVARKFNLDDNNITPAHTFNDGMDYEPSKTAVVLGHHFASIAGAGPIVGPVIAVTFGWIPALIWILIGGVFFGAVHDLTSLVAAMRHSGKSIGDIIRQYIGLPGKQLFMVFSFATLILIIAVFTDIIAKTFVTDGGVASSSFMFVALAIGFGSVNKRITGKAAFTIASLLGVILMYYFVYLGTQLPITLNYSLWVAIILLYAFVASVTPVSFLLQPRDYLSSFLLYGLMILAVIGVMIDNPQIKMNSDVQLNAQNLGYIFPVLFVTIACGAISGFHSLVASGTTCKQIDKESNAKIVGFGGMLIESFLAVIALCSVLIISREEYTERLQVDGPVVLFAQGLGKIIAALHLPAELATTFVALTVSAFALTTLDTCARLARFCFQEFLDDFNLNGLNTIAKNRFSATGIVVVLSICLLSSGEFITLWPIFGSANQLLAALTLLAVSVWLMKRNIKTTFVLIPTFFMFAVTLSSLILVSITNFVDGSYTIALIASLLFILAMILIWQARKSLKTEYSLHESADTT